MKDVTVKITGITPYSASRPHDNVRPNDESHEDFDKRTWREKAHFDDREQVYIPGVAFKLALDECVRLKGEKIKGKGNKTHTGAFASGVAAMSDMFLGIKKDDLKSITIYANLDGVRGGGKRGNRVFPMVLNWSGEVSFRIFNEEISKADFERFFTEAGILSGVGRGRPSKGCPAGNGRFKVESYTWSEV